MDPDKSWHRPDLIRPTTDAVDRQSMRDADRSYLSKKVLAGCAFAGGVAVIGGLVYLADRFIGEKDRQAHAPEISLDRYLHHLRLGNLPVVPQGEKVVKAKYVQLSGFATFEVRRTQVTTNGSYLVRTYLFDSTNMNENGSNTGDVREERKSGERASTGITSNASNNSNGVPCQVKVRFQMVEPVVNLSPFPCVLQEQPHQVPVTLTVATSQGRSVQVKSNEVLLSPISLQVMDE